MLFNSRRSKKHAQLRTRYQVDHTMNVALIGCTPSEIISACQLTISRLVKEGHKIYAIIPSSSNASESSPSSSAFSETLMVPKLSCNGYRRDFFYRQI